MEKIIQDIPNTDQATKVFLQEIVDKKTKLSNLEKYHRLSVITSFLLGAALLVNSYSLLADTNENILEEIYYQFFRGNITSLLFFFMIISFAWLKIVKSKLDKLEDEYHALRKELISKSNDIWQDGESWRNRYLVFQIMKEKYDINLYFENK